MNKLPIIQKIFFALLCFTVGNVNAQCTISNHAPNPWATMLDGDYDYVQSFTADCSGNMEYFQLISTQAGTFDGGVIEVYDGNVASGTPIYTQNYTDIVIANAGDPITMNITGSLPLVSGNQYSFRFDANASMNFEFTTDDTYPGGNVWQGGISYTPMDFNFDLGIGSCSSTSITPDLASLPPQTGACSVANPTIPTATNNCGAVVNGVTDVTFPILTQGTTQVTWTFDDGEGNTTTQTQDFVNPTIDNTITVTGNTLESNQASANYQWLDCDAELAPITGETGQSYMPAASGNYAVEISIQGCVDTSSCELISIVGIEELKGLKKELIKIVDLLGRETEFKPNTQLLFIYSDGTTERVMEVE